MPYHTSEIHTMYGKGKMLPIKYHFKIYIWYLSTTIHFVFFFLNSKYGTIVHKIFCSLNLYALERSIKLSIWVSAHNLIVKKSFYTSFELL